jgi:hypothetical protein
MILSKVDLPAPLGPTGDQRDAQHRHRSFYPVVVSPSAKVTAIDRGAKETG